MEMAEDFDPGVGSQLDQATKDAYDYFTGAKAIPNNFFSYHADNRPKIYGKFHKLIYGIFNNSCLGYIIIASIILLICSYAWLFIMEICAKSAMLEIVFISHISVSLWPAFLAAT